MIKSLDEVIGMNNINRSTPELFLKYPLVPVEKLWALATCEHEVYIMIADSLC